jgi:hypothetical protein
MMRGSDAFPLMRRSMARKERRYADVVRLAVCSSIAITVLRVRHSMSWQKNFARLPGRQ